MNNQGESSSFVAQPIECPNCGENRVNTKLTTERFDYGSGSKAVSLEARVPYRKCDACGFEYTDSEAEEAKHEAICKHLHVFPPKEVVSVRGRYGISRAAFAEGSAIIAAELFIFLLAKDYILYMGDVPFCVLALFLGLQAFLHGRATVNNLKLPDSD